MSSKASIEESSSATKSLVANIPEGELSAFTAALDEYRSKGGQAPLQIGPGMSGCTHAVYLHGPRQDLIAFWRIRKTKDNMPRDIPKGFITNIHPHQLSRFKVVLYEYLRTPLAARLKIAPGTDGCADALWWDGPERNIELFWSMYSPTRGTR